MQTFMHTQGCSTAMCVYMDEGGSISWWSDTQLLTEQWDAQAA